MFYTEIFRYFIVHFSQFLLCMYTKINKNILKANEKMSKIHYTLTIYVYA